MSCCAPLDTMSACTGGVRGNSKGGRGAALEAHTFWNFWGVRAIEVTGARGRAAAGRGAGACVRGIYALCVICGKSVSDGTVRVLVRVDVENKGSSFKICTYAE